MAFRHRKSPTAERGYGTHYRKTRAQWAPHVAGGTVRCWRPDCQRLIEPDEPWHLGHKDDDRSMIMGPEHAACNLGAAARKAATIRHNRHTTRTWGG
jgi:hypothetical protein